LPARCALSVALAHGVAVVLISIWVWQEIGDTKGWVRSLLLYAMDLPLAPLYGWLEDRPNIENDFILVAAASLVLGTAMYAIVGWWCGSMWLAYQKRRNGSS